VWSEFFETTKATKKAIERLPRAKARLKGQLNFSDPTIAMLARISSVLKLIDFEAKVFSMLELANIRQNIGWGNRTRVSKKQNTLEPTLWR